MATTRTYDIPQLDLAGSSYEIGVQHGEQLAPQILRQLVVYRALFKEACKFEWAHVRTVADEYRAGIARLAPGLLEEMRGIADGVWNTQAGARARGEPRFMGLGSEEGGDEYGETIDILDVVALNARSEIALGQWDDGCTSLAWRLRGAAGEKQLLAQNWDWRQSVGENLAMMSIAKEGKPKIWMVVEPGIVGKIGFNSNSVGVCLNAIRARPVAPSLLPIHLLLRIALECDSVDSAISTFEKLGGAASSQHILIADVHGARGLELSPLGGVYLPEDARGIVTHTNHFLQNKLVNEPPWLTGSPVRLERANTICDELIIELARNDRLGEVDAELLRKRLFADTFNTPQAICCSPDPNRVAAIQTLFNIVMNFEPGREPSAEVVFGKPGSGEESSVYRMPW